MPRAAPTALPSPARFTPCHGWDPGQPLPEAPAAGAGQSMGNVTAAGYRKFMLQKIRVLFPSARR